MGVGEKVAMVVFYASKQSVFFRQDEVGPVDTDLWMEREGII